MGRRRAVVVRWSSPCQQAVVVRWSSPCQQAVVEVVEVVGKEAASGGNSWPISVLLAPPTALSQVLADSPRVAEIIDL